MTVSEVRRQFAHTWTDMAYLNHAAVSPMGFHVREAIHKYTRKRSLTHIEPYPWAMKVALEAKQLFAQIIHSKPEELAFVGNTSEGIASFATAYPWQSGDEVVLNPLEFPANKYPWLNLERLGVKVVDAPLFEGTQIRAEDIASVITERTRVVSISHVQFLTGAKADLAAIGTLCKERNIIFVVDAIQSIPHTPIDVEAMHVDVLATGSHKWLMAPEGLGILYIRESLLPKLHQSHLGWTSVSDPFNFDDINPNRLREGAARFENGTLSYMLISGLRASLKLFHEFGISNVEEEVMQRSDYLVDRFQTFGFDLVTPAERELRSGIVTIIVKNAEAVVERLHKQNIIVSLRSGKLRAAPHYYNTEEELKRLVVALGE